MVSRVSLLLLLLAASAVAGRGAPAPLLQAPGAQIASGSVRGSARRAPASPAAVVNFSDVTSSLVNGSLWHFEGSVAFQMANCSGVVADYTYGCQAFAQAASSSSSFNDTAAFRAASCAENAVDVLSAGYDAYYLSCLLLDARNGSTIALGSARARLPSTYYTDVLFYTLAGTTVLYSVAAILFSLVSLKKRAAKGLYSLDF